MIKTLLFDFFNVILRAENPDADILASLHTAITQGQLEPFFKTIFNQELLTWLKKQKEVNTVAILSASPILEESHVQLYLQPFVHKTLLSKNFGFPKDNPELYIKVADYLKTQPEHILFIDDELIRVLAAQEAGIHGLHFIDNPTFFTAIKQYEL